MFQLKGTYCLYELQKRTLTDLGKTNMIITLLVVKNMEDFEKFGGIARRYPVFEMANRKLKKELV